MAWALLNVGACEHQPNVLHGDQKPNALLAVCTKEWYIDTQMEPRA